MNEFLTPDVIAREALLDTEDRIVFANSIVRGYAQEWAGSAVGDTIRIRAVTELQATSYIEDSPVVFGDIKEGSVQLTIEEHLHVPVKVTSKQWKLELDSFTQQIVAPAMKGMTKGMEKYALEQVKKVANYAENVSGVPSDDVDLGEIEAQSIDMGFPASDPTFYLLNARTKNSLITGENKHMYDASVRADGGEAFRKAQFGTILGLSGLVSNLLPKKAVSTADGETGTTTGASGISKTPVTITIDGLTNGVVVEEADILEFTNLDSTVTRCSVKTGVTATGSSDSLEVFYVDAAIDAGATVDVKSIGLGCVYNSGAFALATIPMDELQSAKTSYVYDDHIGFGIRVVFMQTGALTDGIVFDSLAGADHINHKLAFRTDLK